MSDSERYDAIVIRGGKGRKTLAMYLGKQNYKVALVERDPLLIGGGCIQCCLHPDQDVHRQRSTRAFH
jgi:probable pyridine nucleotide-disulfide oxidoreductase